MSESPLLASEICADLPDGQNTKIGRNRPSGRLAAREDHDREAKLQSPFLLADAQPQPIASDISREDAPNLLRTAGHSEPIMDMRCGLRPDHSGDCTWGREALSLKR